MIKKMFQRKKNGKSRHFTSAQARYRNQKAYYSLGVFSLMLGLMFTVDQGFHELAIDSTLENTVLSKKEEGSAYSPLTMSSSLSSNSNSSPTRSFVSNWMEREFDKTKTLSLADRINYWSQYLEKNQKGRKKLTQLAVHYEIKDAFPIIPEKYNSLTFVETVVSLAKSEDSNELVSHLLSLRSSKNKTHFMRHEYLNESNWISQNQRSKRFTDITQSIAGQSKLELPRGEKMIRAIPYPQRQASSAELKQNERRIAFTEKPNRLALVPYIEISKLEKVLPFIPNGTIISLVHKNEENQAVIISHPGFVIRDGHQVLLRYSSFTGLIRTNELSSYLRSLMRSQQSQRKWPLIGVNFNQIMNDSASESKRFKDSI